MAQDMLLLVMPPPIDAIGGVMIIAETVYLGAAVALGSELFKRIMEGNEFWYSTVSVEGVDYSKPEFTVFA